MFEDIFTLILKAEKTLKNKTNVTPIFLFQLQPLIGLMMTN